MDEDFNVDDDDDGGGGEWLATYGDLVTLLLCFFVLLFAMSTVDNIKFKALANSFNPFMGTPPGISTNSGESIIDLNPNPTDGAEELMDKLYNEVKELLNAEGLSGEIDLENLEKGVLLIFKDDMLFESGKANLRPEVKNILHQLGSILRKYDKLIRVEGHTDNIPISNSKFASNWELSTARAISVVRYFTEELPQGQKIIPSQFEVAGLSEFNPVAPNDTPANRQKNRRIEIIVIK